MLIGLGIGLTHIRRSGSGAGRLLGSETNGLALAASDQSLAIRDTTTPANAYASAGIVSGGALIGPGGKLTYASPSPKLCQQSDGTYKYGAHNLYLNSAAPANQSVTVQSGASYTMTVTGTVSITLSGATTGTITSAAPVVFTAGTATLTCGSTSGSGTVHLRLTNSVTDYISNSGTALYAIPYEWDASGNMIGIRYEQARTNLFLNNRAAATQNITVSATAYTLSFFGTGTITLSGTSTAGPLVGTGATDRVTLTFTPTAGTLTCTVSGSMDLVQVEAGTYASSPIITYGSTVTRAADDIYLLTSAFPYSATAGTLFCEFATPAGSGWGSNISYAATLKNWPTTTDVAGLYRYNDNIGGAVVSSNVTEADLNRASYVTSAYQTVKATIAFTANDARVAVDGVLTSQDTSVTMPSGVTRLGLTRNIVHGVGGHIRRILYVPRRMSDAELQALTA